MPLSSHISLIQDVFEIMQVHSSWFGTFNPITIDCDADNLQTFPLDEFRSLHARHHKFRIHKLETNQPNQLISQQIPADFGPYDVSIVDTQFPSSLSAEDPSFLARVTELDVHARLEGDLDLWYLPSLQRLSIDSLCADAWQTLQCRPLMSLKLADVNIDLTQLRHPISAKCVKISFSRPPERLDVARLFPDAEDFSVIVKGYHPQNEKTIELDLGSMSQLRQLSIRNVQCSLLSSHPIHLSYLAVDKTQGVSKTITASWLNCDQISLALQMVPRLKRVLYGIFDEFDRSDSLLMLPRTVVIETTGFIRTASHHMLLNRYHADRFSRRLQRVQRLAFSTLSSRYDEGLLLRLLREAQDVSQFEWNGCSLSRDQQCQAFRHMLQSQQPFNWSRIICSRTHVDALKLLLTERPQFAKHAFGVEQMTLLHAVCSMIGSNEANGLDLFQCLLQHGADPLVRDAKGQNPLDLFPRLKYFITRSR